MRNHKIVLELLLKRLEPVVGKVTPDDFGYWEGDDDLGGIRKQRNESGWYKLAAAVLEARQALASNDPQRIGTAATLICPPLQRDGLELKAKYEVTTQRRNGGKTTGAKQHKDAALRMKPYVEEYNRLVHSGVHYLKARREVMGLMTKNGVAVPSVPTVNKYFPKPPKNINAA